MTTQGGTTNPPRLKVIAEAGVNHNGSEDLAHTLIDVAAAAGADVVKFQTFDPDKLTSDHAKATPYQQRSGNVDQTTMLRSLTLPAEAWARLQAHAHEAGIAFMSTPFDLDSAHLLLDLGVATMKVSSGELTNLPFLHALSKLGVPLLVSTGMGDAAEVAAAVAACAEAPELTLFHCVSAYPAPMPDCNLRAIPAMAQAHRINVGWSDHTLGNTTAIAAVALGATVLEKHFTTDRSLPGPDHVASLDPDELTDYISVAQATAAALGDGVKRRMPSEQENAGLVRRSWHATRDLRAGDLLAPEDTIALRPELGLSPAIEVTGTILLNDVAAGDPIRSADVASR